MAETGAENMKFFLSYLNQRKHSIIVFILFSAVFSVSFILYDITPLAVVYPALLCAFLGAVFMFLISEKNKNKHKTLCALYKYTDNITDNFPTADTIDDLDYQEIINRLVEEGKQRDTAMNIKYFDMIDYYTLWAHEIKTPIAAMKLNLQEF